MIIMYVGSYQIEVEAVVYLDTNGGVIKLV